MKSIFDYFQSLKYQKARRIIFTNSDPYQGTELLIADLETKGFQIKLISTSVEKTIGITNEKRESFFMKFINKIISSDATQGQCINV